MAAVAAKAVAAAWRQQLRAMGRSSCQTQRGAVGFSLTGSVTAELLASAVDAEMAVVAHQLRQQLQQPWRRRQRAMGRGSGLGGKAISAALDTLPVRNHLVHSPTSLSYCSIHVIYNTESNYTVTQHGIVRPNQDRDGWTDWMSGFSQIQTRHLPMGSSPPFPFTPWANNLLRGFCPEGVQPAFIHFSIKK